MDRFAASNFESVDLEGVEVHPMLRLDVRASDIVRIEWLSSESPRIQGLSLRLRKRDVLGAGGRGGALRADGREAPTIVLWQDTAPPTVEVTCVQVASGAELQVSNRWRQPDGREDEWLNNFGMLIETDGGGQYVVRCSDGVGEPSFDDLVVAVERRHTAAR
jgi:hypothetical protein